MMHHDPHLIDSICVCGCDECGKSFCWCLECRCDGDQDHAEFWAARKEL